MNGFLLLDRAWALAHNTGPIFNKGFLFANQKSSDLMTILNAQRAGLIPGLISFNASSWGGGYISAEVGAVQKELARAYPLEFGKPYSAEVLKKAGSLVEGSGVSVNLKQLMGGVTGSNEFLNEAKKKHKKVTFPAGEGLDPIKEEPHKPIIQITPTDSVTIIQRGELKSQGWQ